MNHHEQESSEVRSRSSGLAKGLILFNLSFPLSEQLERSQPWRLQRISLLQVVVVEPGMDTSLPVITARVAFAVIVIAIGLQFRPSDSLTWIVAIGAPLLYAWLSGQLADPKCDSVLYAQIHAQWNRLPKGTVRSTGSVVKFIAISLSALRDDHDGCDVRDVSDADREKDVSILMRFDESGRISSAKFISWDTSLREFEQLLSDSVQDNGQPVELVARLINGRVVYLVATFGRLNQDQQQALLTVCQVLNDVPSANQLRPFKCRNFIQRGRKEPKIRQVL
jgi:hypothetical protein